MRSVSGSVIGGLFAIAEALGCSNLEPCKYDGHSSVAAGANGYPSCNEREPPGEITLSIEMISAAP